MRVTLTHRLGQNDTGTELDLTATQGQWLLERGHATPAAEFPAEDTNTDAPPANLTDTPTPSLAALRARAEGLGLPTYGSKATLAARIDEHETS